MIIDFVGKSTAPVPIDVSETIRFFCKDALDTMVIHWRSRQKSA
jgi:hypothetical protein